MNRKKMEKMEKIGNGESIVFGTMAVLVEGL